MANSKIWIIAGVFLIVLAVMTNPSIQTHREEVKEQVKSYLAEKSSEGKNNEANPFAELGDMLGVVIVNTVIDNIVTRDNYFLFSTTKATYEEQTKIIGFGAFGYVVISGKFKGALDSGDFDKALQN